MTLFEPAHAFDLGDTAGNVTPIFASAPEEDETPERPVNWFVSGVRAYRRLRQIRRLRHG